MWRRACAKALRHEHMWGEGERRGLGVEDELREEVGSGQITQGLVGHWEGLGVSPEQAGVGAGV